MLPPPWQPQQAATTTDGSHSAAPATARGETRDVADATINASPPLNPYTPIVGRMHTPRMHTPNLPAARPKHDLAGTR